MSYLDKHGDPLHRIEQLTAQVEAMMSPVRCTHCRGIYDLGNVTVTARYADCSVWESPCCGLTVDDRGEGWKSRPDYTELRKR